MIIDFHTHIFPENLAERALTALLSNIDELFLPITDGTKRSLLQHMDKSGVTLSIIQPVLTKPSQFTTLNTWAAELNSDRLVAFGSINPHSADYRRDIDFIVDLGLKGLKFHCEYQDFFIDAPEMLRIYDYALSRDLIILHHAGGDPGYNPPFKSSPKRFAAIADAMRGGVMVAAHFGGYQEWDDVERYLVGKNIYLDTSMGFEYFPQEQFIRIVRSHGADKILFASDSPWSDATDELRRLAALPLTDSERQLILGDNAKKVLRLYQ